MTWEFAPVLDAAHRAALSAGKPLEYVCPPAGWAARALFAALPRPAAAGPTIVVGPEITLARDLAAQLDPLTDLAPIHPATGLVRTETLLRAGRVGTLLATLPDTLTLVRRSVLKPEAVGRLVLAWPEQLLALGLGDALDKLLADAPTAHRLVLTADETAIGDLLDLHARRAAAASGKRSSGLSPRLKSASLQPSAWPWRARASCARAARRAIRVRGRLIAPASSG